MRKRKITIWGAKVHIESIGNEKTDTVTKDAIKRFYVRQTHKKTFQSTDASTMTEQIEQCFE